MLTRSLLSSDVAQLVPIHRAAFSDHLHGHLGNGYAATFLQFFADPVAAGSIIGIVVVDDDNRVLGYVCGVVDSGADKLVQQTEPAAARALVARPWLWFHRDLIGKVQSRALRALGRPHDVIPTLPSPTMYLYAIGVAAAAQRRGVAQMLLQAFEQQSKNAGMAAMVLSVFESNTAAIAAYERAQWQRSSGKHFGGHARYYEKRL